MVVGSPDEAAARKAISIIEDMTREVEVGTVYTGKVTRVMPFGAIVQILPGKDGMVHISELADYRVANVEDVVKLGDEITVKVIRVEDGKDGAVPQGSAGALHAKAPVPAVNRGRRAATIRPGRETGRARRDRRWAARRADPDHRAVRDRRRTDRA